MLRLLAVVDRDLKKFRRNPVVFAMSILMPQSSAIHFRAHFRHFPWWW